MTVDTCSQEQLSEYAAVGCKALDAYMEALNSGDTMRWAKSLQYPHIRLAGDRVQIWNTPEEFARDNDMATLSQKVNWGYSKWDWRHLVQYGPGKLHFAVQFSRYTVNDVLISTFESMYILTKPDGVWRVQGRSSYAGIFTGNTGF